MKQGFVYLIGAGPGDPELITSKALNAMACADCIIYDYLANPVLVEPYSCEKIYVGKQGSNHTLSQEEINRLIIKKAKEGKIIARIKGGDPFIFGRGGEEAEELVEEKIPFCIIPGISSFYSAPAYAGIPLTHRDFANAFEVVTGHRRADADVGEDVNFPDYHPERTYTFLMGVKNLPHISDSLILRKNFPPDTPVAVISWGTTSRQKVVTGPLDKIKEIVQREKISPPSIIVVGRVVALREKLRWFDNQPLFGKKIVVTRTRSQASKLTRLLVPLGAQVMEFPTIEIQRTLENGALRNALNRIRDFDWLLLTSQNSVNILFDEIFDMAQDVRMLGHLQIGVIGPATGNELLRYGIRPDIVPKEYVAESLLQEMEKTDVKGKRILLPCAEDARPDLRDGLSALGAHVERLHTYRAVKPENISAENIQALQNADIITFTSSSTVKNFFSLVPSVNAKLASIGPITSRTIEKFETRADITAKEYTIEGLVEAIAEYYET